MSQYSDTVPCRADADAMFPGSNEQDIDYAKSFCRRCPAVESCLQWALETGEQYGVWGGLSEKERLALKQRPVRPISIDAFTGTPRTPRQGQPLQAIWDNGTLPDGDHILWVGPKVIYRRGETQVTPNRLAFYLDRERWPEGETRRTCDVRGCVKPSHLVDRLERAEEADLAVAV
jgi:hypothetical protein